MDTIILVNEFNSYAGEDILRRVADASELGIKPGELRKKLLTNLGNGIDLELEHWDTDKMVYKQPFGCFELVVIND